MAHRLYLAWRYLCFHKWKSGILIASITLVVYVPAALHVLVQLTEQRLRSRADATPLIVGAKGSQLDLVLNALYFQSEPPASVPVSEVSRIQKTGLALAIPLHTRFRSREHPIVGTTLDYFEFRGLKTTVGRPFGMLGECLIGSRVARNLEIGIGDHVISSAENPFDFAGVYPLKMRVVGILETNDSPDDSAIFVDLKTAWIIEGLGHGHDDLQNSKSSAYILKRDGQSVTANASVVQYAEITEANIGRIHFHGDSPTFPVNAVIVVPHSPKSGTLLQGRYQSSTQSVQIAIPALVIDQLLETIFTVQNIIVAAVVIVGIATGLTSGLVFLLSLRLRQREFQTMRRIGCSRGTVSVLVSCEVVLVLGSATLLAALLTLVTSAFSEQFIRWLVL